MTAKTDVEIARDSSTLSVDTVKSLLTEPVDLETRNKLSSILAQDPDFDPKSQPRNNRRDQLRWSFRVTRKLVELKRKHGWDLATLSKAMNLVEAPLPLGLHLGAFAPVIESQTTDEQKDAWLEKTRNLEIFGCYAQTELGHGSNVQRLETTATYDANTQEFIINSPTTTATKFWIGAAGVLATHSLVQAQLILPDGTNAGPHLFLLQIRDMYTHKTLPGIEIGDIGPKAMGGYNTTDNGFLRFDKVRIPRFNMLARFASVTPEGKYIKPPHAKLSYGGMVSIRAHMTTGLGWKIGKGVTIAIRYAHTRRQFGQNDNPNKKETPVIRYPSVHMRLLPVLAQSYAYITVGKDMEAQFKKMQQGLSEGNVELLAETHATSSGLKNYVTNATVESLEICRRSMGGHGFLNVSGIGPMYADILPAPTYEGENFVLAMQVSRSAAKAYDLLRSKGTPSKGLHSYLDTTFGSQAKSGPINVTDPKDWLNPQLQLTILNKRAGYAVENFVQFKNKVNAGGADKDGYKVDKSSWKAQKIAKTVTENHLATRMAAAIAPGGLLRKPNMDKVTEKAVNDLMNLFILNLIENAASEILQYSLVTPQSLDTLSIALLNVANDIIPHSIRLCDAFEFDDKMQLQSSALGRYDGRVYDAILDSSKKHTNEDLGPEWYDSVYRDEIEGIIHPRPSQTRL